MSRSLEMAARRLGRAGWSAVVTVLLVEGREMLAMDEEGTIPCRPQHKLS